MLRGRLQVTYTPAGGRPRTLDRTGTLATLLDHFLKFLRAVMADDQPKPKRRARRS